MDEANITLKTENQHLAQQIELQKQQLEHLQQRLDQSLKGNAELMLKDLQSKLDVLIAQTKKRNRRDLGNKTEKHNPRPAQASSTPKTDRSTSEDRTRI